MLTIAPPIYIFIMQALGRSYCTTVLIPDLLWVCMLSSTYYLFKIDINKSYIQSNLY